MLNKKMRAAFYNDFGELNQIKIGKMLKPDPGEGEVLVRVKAAGVNPVDAFAARGMLKNAIPTIFPAIPGWDAAGTVEECGHAVSRFNNGDTVYAYLRRPTIQHGTFAEYVSVPESYLAHCPKNISIDEAGAIPLAGLTAYQSLFDAGNLKNGETLLILGASGGVGSLAIQLAKAKGAVVIGVASKANQDYMKDLGADKTIDYENNNVGKAASDLAPDGVDMIFHCSRGDSLAQSIGTLKNKGRLVSITNSNPERPDGVQFEYVFVEPNAVQLKYIQELADEGKLKVPISKKYALDDADKALKEVESLHTQGKMIITP